MVVRNLDNCESLHNEYSTWRNFLENHCSFLSEDDNYIFYYIFRDRTYKVEKETGNIEILISKS